MNNIIKIGIIGDYDGRPSHIATQEAIKHSGDYLGVTFVADWIPTVSLLEMTTQKLKEYQGIWCAPGSPYQSMQGAINGIEYARVNNVPFIGTCGGFQHAVLEFAKNKLHYEEIGQDTFDLYSPNLFISALSCSLVGQSRKIIINPDSIFYKIYQCGEVDEKYNCNFGLNKEFEVALIKNHFQIAGKDAEGEVRAMVNTRNDYFVITLFQPQLSSTSEQPHPIVTSFLKAADYSYRSK